MNTPTLSKYPVLENRPINQWKVTELKKELKRRRLKTGGLKLDLIKRLDEALRAEMEEAEATNVEVDDNNGVGDAKPENAIHDTPVNIYEQPSFEAGDCETVGFGNANQITGLSDATKESEGNPNLNGVQLEVVVNSSGEHLGKDEIVEGQQLGLVNNPIHGVGIVTTTDVEVASEIVSDGISEGYVSDKTAGEEVLLHGKQEHSENIAPACVDVKLDSPAQKNQESEVSSSLGLPVKSVNSVSSDSISFIEKNDLEDKLVADNVKLDSYVNPELVEPSSSGLVPGGGESLETRLLLKKQLILL